MIGEAPFAWMLLVIAASTLASVPFVVSPSTHSAMTRAPARAAKSDAFCDPRRCAKAYPPSIVRPAKRMIAVEASAKRTRN